MEHREVYFDVAAEDYAKWNSVFPDEAFDRMAGVGIELHGARVLDLGCGSGVACRALTKRGSHVIGIDPAAELIQQAKEMAGVDTAEIEYIVSPAERLPLPNGVIDVVTAIRSWHWFDRSRVISEIKRVGRKGSWFVVMDSVFLPEKSEVAKRTADCIREFRGEGTLAAGSKARTTQFRNGFPLEWYSEWEEAGFDLIDEWTFEYSVPYSHEGWRGRVRSLSAVLSLPAEHKQSIDAKLSEILRQEFPNEPLVIPHECRGVIWRLKGAM